MEKLKSFGMRYGPAAAVYAFIIAVLAFLYGYGSRTFLPGLSAAEVQLIHDTHSFSSIIQNPLWLPYKLLAYLSLKLGVAPQSYRFISAFIAICAVFAFYSICRKWYRPRIATLTTCLFALSSITLTMARVATPAILLYTWILLSAAVIWFRSSRRARFAPFVIIVSLAFGLYIPGAAWFIVLLGAWFWREIPRYFKDTKSSAIIFGSVLAVLISIPLVYSFYKNPHLIGDWLLLPHSYYLQNSFSTFKSVPSAFFYRMTPNPAYNLGVLPLFDAFSGTMLLIGMYAYRKRLRLERTIVYALSAIVSISLAVANGNQFYLVMLVPFLYLLVGHGMAFLLEEWRTVFPRNPLARFVGTLILSLAVLTACLYHMNRFYLAWQNAPATKAVYTNQL